MTANRPDTTDNPQRRGFFGRLAGAAVLGVAGFAATPLRAQPAAPAGDGPHWPGKLKGRYRQVVDAYDVSGGRPLDFSHNFLATNPAGAATAVLVLRAAALPLALNSAMWEKYKIGESFRITDPETKAPAVKNPFLQPKPGVLHSEDEAIDRLLASGVVIGACNVALHGQSKALAHNAGATPEAAAKEWAANLVPGITLIPSGVWGVNRAQLAGCTYCTGS